MQSNEYQVVKRTRKFHMNPQQGGDQVVTSSKVRTFGSTRTGGAGDFSSFGMGGASASGKREMNFESSAFGGDGVHFSGRGGASGASKTVLLGSAQGSGFNSNTRNSHTSGNEDSRMVTKTTRTVGRLGGAGGEGSSGMMKQTTTTETRTVGRFGRTSQNSRDGSKDNGSTGRGSKGYQGLEISARGGKLKIESETVSVPTAQNEKNRLRIDT